MKGSCLCGAVRFETSAKASSVSACHCSQCRKQSGHIWASAEAPEAQVTVQGEVRWFAASPKALRGFCPTCGSFLFWKETDDTMLSIALGAVDGPTGLRLERHIFTADKGDYYDLPTETGVEYSDGF